MRELQDRLDQLARDLERLYVPALERLQAAHEPGAVEVDDELQQGASGGFLEELRWMRLDLAGLVFADGDPDLYSFWRYELSRGDADTAEHAPQLMHRVFRDIGEEEADPVEALARFLRGRQKAATR